jgi:tetratricopeptide (TPR) repeat protein
VELDPGNPISHWYLGIALRFERRPYEAIPVYREAARLSPGELGIAYGLGSSLAMLGNTPEAEQALRLAEVLVRANDGLGATLPRIAQAYRHMGLREHAVELVREFEEWAADHPAGEGDWAAAYLATGDYEKALDRLRRAMDKISAGEGDEGFWNLAFILRNIYSDPVLERPEFVRVRSRLGYGR